MNRLKRETCPVFNRQVRATGGQLPKLHPGGRSAARTGRVARRLKAGQAKHHPKLSPAYCAALIIRV